MNTDETRIKTEERLGSDRLDHILTRLPSLRIGVLGDLFLDRYLDIDAALTEPSLETGLDAYQVVGVRSYPGAAGTVINNLAALSVGQIVPIGVIGKDGEGWELQQALEQMSSVRLTHVAQATSPNFRTPTYTKPMLHASGQPARELNRLDIKNRMPLPEMDALILPALEAAWPDLDALIVVDQVSEADCGVVTRGVRTLVADLGAKYPERLILVDSRARLGLFEKVALKPNDAECRRLVPNETSVEEGALTLARQRGRPVFRTLGARGIIVADGRSQPPLTRHVPAPAVQGPIDPVGAGDSVNAAIASAVAAGASLVEAAALANLVASITIQQLGVTGTATPAQVRRRWQEVYQPSPPPV
jgi:bifunctional ADP-heptose synthase (sugar kinase/adenylyltransferase)